MNSFFSPSKPLKGQGLVEYAIIIALVAIIVIVVVGALGPRVGNTFSSVNNSLGGGGILGGEDDEPTAVPPEDFVHVANEGESFNIPAGTYEVQYGAGGAYFTQHITGPTTRSCNSATFGDPAPGVPKSCNMRISP